MENAVRSPFTWNTEPGSLMILPEFSQSLDRYPFYWRHLRVSADTTNSSSLFTAVVYVTSRSSLYSASPLHRLMRALSKSSKLHKVIFLGVFGIKLLSNDFCSILQNVDTVGCCSWRKQRAARGRYGRHVENVIKNPTQSIDAYLCEEQSRQISFRAALK